MIDNNKKFENKSELFDNLTSIPKSPNSLRYPLIVLTGIYSKNLIDEIKYKFKVHKNTFKFSEDKFDSKEETITLLFEKEDKKAEVIGEGTISLESLIFLRDLNIKFTYHPEKKKRSEIRIEDYYDPTLLNPKIASIQEEQELKEIDSLSIDENLDFIFEENKTEDGSKTNTENINIQSCGESLELIYSNTNKEKIQIPTYNTSSDDDISLNDVIFSDDNTLLGDWDSVKMDKSETQSNDFNLEDKDYENVPFEQVYLNI